ncbi:MAG: hypothetical protein ACOCZ6_03750 [Nanoarchaeota archaeon]
MSVQANFCKPESTYLNYLEPEKTELFKGKRETDVDEIFSEYASLDEIINLNRRQDQETSREMPDFPEDYTARLIFNLGGKSFPKDFQIAFRTNYNTDEILKRPNIVHLMDNETGSTVYILRNAIKHEPGYMRALFGPQTNIEDYKENRLSYETEYLQIIPEPLLIKTLDEMFQDPHFYQYDGFNRCIPEFRTLDDSSFPEKISYIRPFYGEQVINSPLNQKTTQAMVNYLTTIWSLGLFEKKDRQTEHYVLTKNDGKPAVINFDPDAFAWLPNSQETLHHFEESADMKNEISGKNKTLNRRVEDIVSKAEQKALKNREQYLMQYSFMHYCTNQLSNI